uniref:GPI-anchor transamidase n=1 Tax=Octactis speculum TaxID=3111310 RepID=A0A7S2AZY3_9STRA|mmetsp:Transcript_17900/g.24178  ORF Transcript_17900/g.24178 Transcript_17900/m.24178 type:complete len:226 (+) Transcript_17900:81-758(+)
MQEELSSVDLGRAFLEMHLKRRYGHVLLVLDTCQAATLANAIDAPNISVIASSLPGQNSYALHADPTLGVSTIDRFTAVADHFFKRKGGDLAATNLGEMVKEFHPSLLRSDIFVSAKEPTFSLTPVTNYFGSQFTPVLTSETTGHEFGVLGAVSTERNNSRRIEFSLPDGKSNKYRFVLGESEVLSHLEPHMRLRMPKPERSSGVSAFLFFFIIALIGGVLLIFT